MKAEQLELLKKQLPAVPGIHGKENYLNTAVLVLLYQADDEYHFIFEKRSSEIRQGGEVCFPGGVFDPGADKSFEDTALRETREEIGLAEDKITLLGRLDTFVAPMGATIDACVGIARIESLEELQLNHDEVEKVFSVPVSFFEQTEPEQYEARLRIHPTIIDEKTGQEVVLFPAGKLGLPEMYTKPWGTSKYQIYLYQTEHGVIWGLTARFIVDVVQKLKSGLTPAGS